MNKIYIEVSIGELIDKITILEIKKEKISNKNNLEFIDKEYASLNQSLKKNVKISTEIKNLWIELKSINLKLWEIEDEKRLYEKNSDFGEKFIKVSRDIHFLNDERSKIKLEINNYTGSKIKEIKQYTSY